MPKYGRNDICYCGFADLAEKLTKTIQIIEKINIKNEILQ